MRIEHLPRVWQCEKLLFSHFFIIIIFYVLLTPAATIHHSGCQVKLCLAPDGLFFPLAVNRPGQADGLRTLLFKFSLCKYFCDAASRVCRMSILRTLPLAHLEFQRNQTGRDCSRMLMSLQETKERKQLTGRTVVFIRTQGLFLLKEQKASWRRRFHQTLQLRSAHTRTGSLDMRKKIRLFHLCNLQGHHPVTRRSRLLTKNQQSKNATCALFI